MAQERTVIDEQYKLAAGFYARGQWSEAEVAFGELIQAHPNTPQAAAAAFFLPESQMQQGKFSGAYTAFQSFLKQYPDHDYAPRATFRLGESAYRTNRYDIAVRLLEEFVKENPQHELNEFALPYLGQLRNLREEPQLAQMAFETSLRLFPKGALANRSRLGLAKALQSQSHKPGNLEEAKRFYEFLLMQLDPDLAAEARIQLGVAEFDRVDLSAAEKLFADAIKQSEDNAIQAKATYWLGRILMEQEDYERALETFAPLASASFEEPLMTSIWFDGAVAAVQAEQFSLATSWLSKIRLNYPKSKRLAKTVRFEIDLLRKLGRIDDALMLAKSYQVEDKLRDVQDLSKEQIAREMYQNGEYRKSIAAFEKLLDSNATQSKLARWAYLKALAQIKLSQFADAETTLTQVKRSEIDDSLAAMLQLATATAQFGQKHYQAAIPNYQRFLESDPNAQDSQRAKIELAICYSKTDQFPLADTLLTELVDGQQQVSQGIETAIEIAVESAVASQNSHDCTHWLQFLATNSNDDTRRQRAQIRLALARSKSDASQKSAPMSVDAFEKLLLDHSAGQDKSLGHHHAAICNAAIAFANRIEVTDLNGSKRLYRCVIKRAEDSAANIARARLARILQKEGGRQQLMEARQLLDDYLNVADDSARPLSDENLYQLAWLDNDLGDANGSETRFQQLIEQFPNSKYWPDAAYRLLQRHIGNDRIDEAQQLILRVVKKQKSDPEFPGEIYARVLFLEGKLAVQTQDWSRASSAMATLAELEIEPQLKAQAAYWSAEANYQQQKTVEAFEQFQRLQSSSSLSSRHRPWVDLRVAQLAVVRNDWELVESTCDQALRNYPGFSARHELQFLTARVLERKGLLNDARMAFKQAIEWGAGTQTAAQSQWRIGEVFFHQERYADAIAAYYKVDSLYESKKWRSAALIQAGKCQEHLGQPEQAAKLYRQLIKLFPQSEFSSEASSRLVNVETQIRTAKQTKKSTR
ncbi:MAG: tetratricopeptide repeat protein [Planctomycetota bacterium]